MINKNIILIFCMILLVGTISAEEFVYKQNTIVDLEVHCFNNGPCSSNAICNITITDPDGVNLVDNQAMTQSSNLGFFNYTLNTTQTSKYGIYSATGFCKDGGVSEPFNFKPFFNKTGNILDTSESLIYLIVLIGSLILFLLFLYPAIVVPYSNETNDEGAITRVTKWKYVKMAAILAAHSSLVGFLTILAGILNNFATLQITVNIINTLYVIFYALLYGVTITILSVSIFEIYRDMFLRKEILKYGEAFKK